MLTGLVVVALAIGVYGQRAAGAVLVDTDRLAPRWRSVLDVLPLAIISAVIALAALTDDGELNVDARLAGVGVACMGSEEEWGRILHRTGVIDWF